MLEPPHACARCTELGLPCINRPDEATPVFGGNSKDKTKNVVYTFCYSCHVHVRGKDTCSFAVERRRQAGEVATARPVLGVRDYAWITKSDEVARRAGSREETEDDDDDDEMAMLLNEELAKGS